MKEYVVPIILTLAAITALSGMVVFTIALFGDGVKIGDMTLYFS